MLDGVGRWWSGFRMNDRWDARSMKLAKRMLVVAAMALLVVIFALGHRLGGETWDEVANKESYYSNVAFGADVLNGERDRHYSTIVDPYYGLLPNAAAVIASDSIAALYNLSAPRAHAVYRLAIHLSAFFWGIGTVFVCYHLIYLLTQQRAVAFLGAAFLLLYPVWLGQSFFNFKDLPFAFFYTLGLYGSLKALSSEQGDFRQGVIVVAVATLGAAGVKLAGAVLLAPQWLTLALAALRADRPARALAEVGLGALLLFVGTYLITPASWLQPFPFAIDSLSFMGRHPWRGCMVTMGECLAPSSPDWSTAAYLASWLVVRWPTLVLIAAVPATLYLLVVGSARDRWLVAAVAIPMTLLLIRNATLYDGVRHVLFTVPPLIAVIFVSIGKLLATEQYRRVGQLGAILASLNIFFFVIDNITLFPYNYVYFNELARKQANASSFDLDYWGFSLKEAAYMLNERVSAKSGKIRYAAWPSHLVEPFTAANLHRVGQARAKTTGPVALKDFYQVSSTRRNARPYHHCRVVDTVKRSLIFAREPLVLSFVARCKRGDSEAKKGTGPSSLSRERRTLNSAAAPRSH
jgi:hypothetical protein